MTGYALVLALSAKLHPSFAPEARRILDLLPPYDTSDDSAVGHDWTSELDQDGAFRPYTRLRQLAKVLDLGAFASVVLSKQFS